MRIRWLWAFLDLPEADSGRGVEFWSEVTRSRLSPWRGDRYQFATLLPADGDSWVKVQKVGGRGGIHVDLDVDVPLSEARDRAVELGAGVVDDLDDVVVCRSPGGFAFCLTRWSADEMTRGQVRSGAASLLDQVCLDIPQSRYAGEVDFWSTLTGWAVEDDEPDEFARLAWPEGLPLRFLLQRLDDRDGEVRAHLDLSSVHPAAEVARHESLGATRIGPGDGWTVLEDPGGMRYCVTARHPDRRRQYPGGASA